MDKKDLEVRIIRAIDNNKFCSLATVENGKPKQRYMAIFNDGFNIYLGTNRKTHKVEELEGNPFVSLLLGYEPGDSKEIVEIEGTCKISENDDLRKKVWNDDFKKWFEGSNDPDFVVLDITPTRIQINGECWAL
ncbi:general stress protein 26 [Paenibacillus anaericanus]|uniref:pyridoxamine 5'-phosphate oxidase family protein n=1 Tax=Paenibacillus anaericanus TaxID=170367 RepID=UPI00278A775E|nr:pyridoxamine 5'-phosphate oxidase family protein [Paenibacillus anaericanus]MDQ0088145.1 general stress protein 26 [Paenibacillus anaericanus]